MGTLQRIFVRILIAVWLMMPLAFGQCRTEAPVWNPGLYWNYTYQPPEVPITPYDPITYSIEFWVLGSPPQGQDLYILFTIYRTAQGPMPFLAYAPVESPYPILISGFEAPPLLHALDFPLEVGKQWIAKPGYDTSSAITAEVVALERIGTDFGTFDTFHIRYWQNGTVVSDLWYAPAVKSYAKLISPRGILTLEESWQSSAEMAFHTVFRILEEVAESRPDLALEVLSRMVQLGIAQEEASALIDAILGG